MKIIIFILGLAHVAILFASAIALATFVFMRLGRWLMRSMTRRLERKPVRKLRKRSLQPAPETPSP
jgi:hypothetical protein